MKKSSIILVFYISTFIYNSQVYSQAGPPPMAMPKKDNKVLIEKIIEITRYENYFNLYCKKRIADVAQKENWDSKKVTQITQSINFKSFNNTIYNVLSFYDKDELNEMIELFTKLNKKDKSQNLFITNEMIESNLNLYAKSLIEGKFVID